MGQLFPTGKKLTKYIFTYSYAYCMHLEKGTFDHMYLIQFISNKTNQ